MKLYNCTTKAAHGRYCFVSRHSESYSVDLQFGDPAQAEMDDEGVDLVELELDELKGGLELPDLVGTDCQMVIISKRFADATQEQFSLGPCEVFPARLLNKKNRVHADDYVVLNPLGTVDCLNRTASEMDESGDHIKIFGKAVIAASAVPTDRDIFRIEGMIGYVFSERLVDYIRQQGLTNFVFTDMLVS